jgi:hypothetical protein
MSDLWKVFLLLYSKLRSDIRTTFLVLLILMCAFLCWGFYTVDRDWQIRYDKEVSAKKEIERSNTRMQLDYQSKLDSCVNQRNNFMLNLYSENEKEI